MSVDGIGKGGGAPEIGGTGEATSVSDAESVEPATEGVSSEFSLEAAASAQGPNDVAAASDLQRLEQGQITLEQYLDNSTSPVQFMVIVTMEKTCSIFKYVNHVLISKPQPI